MQITKFIPIASCVVLVSFLSGCAGLNSIVGEKTATIECVRVYDVKTDAKLKVVSDALLEGLSRNSVPTVTKPVMTGEIPKEPGHFRLENPFADTKLGLLMNQAGQTPMRVMVCDNSPWTASAKRGSDLGSPVEFKVCVFPYQGGYQIDMFASMTIQSGGLHELSRALTFGSIESPEQWVEKTFLDAVRQVRLKTGGEVALVEAAPELEGTPWLDDNADAIKDARSKN